MYKQRMDAAKEQKEKYTGASTEWQKKLESGGDDLGKSGNSQSENGDLGIVGT